MSGAHIIISSVLLIPLAVVITYYDARYRRIPNPFVLATLIAGLSINALADHWHGVLGSLEGCALAFVLIIGRVERFQCGKQIAAYLGLVPLEDSSGERRRLGHITKQGNSMLRFLLVEAAPVAARSIPQWRNQYFHLAMRRGRKIAKVAMARKLAVRLFWMMRQEWSYEQLQKFGSHAGQPGNRHGVK